MATKLDALVVELTAKIDGFQASLRTATGDIKRFSTQAEKDIGLLGKATEAARVALLRYVSAWAAFEVGKSIISAGVSIQQLENRLKAATGDLQVAGEAMAFVREESERLGLDFKSTADGFAGFAASALRAGLTFKQTKEIFTGVSEAATSMHLSSDRVALVFKALEQIAGKGTVSMEELRGQLGDSLPGAFEIAAKAMGVTNQEFYKMVANGEVLASDFLPRFGEAVRKELGGSVEQASQSAQAAFYRLGNAIYNLEAQMAGAGFIDGVTDAIKRMTAALQDPQTLQGLRDLAALLGLIARAAGYAAESLAKLASLPRLLVNGRLPGAPDPSLPLGALLSGEFGKRADDKTGGLSSGANNEGYTLGKVSAPKPSDKEIKAREKLEGKLDELLYKLGGLGMDEISRDAYDKEGDASERLEDQEKVLKEALDQRLITEQEFRENMLKAELDYQDQLTKIKEDAEEQRSQLTEKASEIEVASRTKAVNAALGLMNMFAGKNKALAMAALAVEKGLAIASTIAASYKSAIAARATYMALGNPAAAEVAYAREIALGQVTAGLIAATGIAQVAMGGGSSSGGSSGGGTVTDENGTTIGGQVNNAPVTKQLFLNIQGSRFSMVEIREIIDQINEAGKDGSRVEVIQR